MSKRKSSRTCEEDLEYLLGKIRKLERKIRDRDNNETPVESAAAPDVQAPPTPRAPTPVPPPPPVSGSPPRASGSPPRTQAGTYVLEKSDWLTDALDPESSEPTNPDTADEPEVPPVGDTPIDTTMTISEVPSTSSETHPQGEVTDVIELDADALEILGEDPSNTEKHGKNILQELATRLQHIATQGLNKETRKDLIAKYPVPANCLHIDAPKVNPEIKVAIPENIAKREKGLEAKQKQMANAISCLGDIISTEINSKNKSKESLQKLMDLGRLLCDIQHSDSITRRNFILFSLKKDVKEHLSNTKIDTFLFSETLSDTLKSVKTINKSGSELKADSAPKNTVKRPKPSTSRNLNRKAPGPAYRPPVQTARSFEPAAPRVPPPQPPAHSSKTWSRQPATTAAPPRRR